MSKGTRYAMTNITALLLALTLTGGPVTSAVCITECYSQPVIADSCHEDLTSGRPSMTAANSCIDRSVRSSVYVAEHRTVSDAPVLTATSSIPTTALMRTDAPAASASFPDAWLKPPLVLRI
jgi:hypothetical protein